MSAYSVAATAFLALTLAAPATSQIRWAKSLDSALAQAKAENKVVFVALNMDGERANDQFVEDHYRDKLLVDLSRHTVNVFCSNNVHKKSGSCPRCKGTTCASHRENDLQVRRKILKLDGDTPVTAPQHLFVTADGEILTSVAHFVTEGELEWMWVDAIREKDPGFAWEPSGRFRAPARFRKGEADTSLVTEKPPTEKQVRQALKDIQKLGTGGGRGRGGWRKLMEGAQKNSRIIIRSDDKKALDWGKSTLKAYRMFRNGLLRDIGQVSPRSWANVVEDWLDSDSQETRKATTIALEKLANPKSVNPLRKAIRQEKEPDIRGRMLRALAASGPAKTTTIRTVAMAAKSDKIASVRAHAVVGVGLLEKREAVTTGLRTALQDEDPLVRSVAAYVIAIRQDRTMLDHLVVSLQAEREASVKAWFEKAIAAVRDGEIGPFREFLPKVLDGNEPGSELDRLRNLADEPPKPAAKGEEKNGEKKTKK